MGALEVDGVSDVVLGQWFEAIRVELQRRDGLAAVIAQNPGVADALFVAAGRVMGAEWVQPLGYHDAYPFDWEVASGGRVWKATRDGASGVPGVSPDWWLVALPNVLEEWQRPHAGSEYAVGKVLTHKGRVWRNDHVGPNGWEPGTVGSQWADLGPVESYVPAGG